MSGGGPAPSSREAAGSRSAATVSQQGASARFRELAALDRRELERVMHSAAPVRPSEVAGSEWRGWNIAPISALLGVRKFLKRIHPPDKRGRVWGENVLAHQSPLNAAWRPCFSARGFLPFGVLVAPADAPRGLTGTLLIAYGAWPARARWNPVAHVADYLVRPFGSRVDLLLGASYLNVGSRRLFLEHFLLERSPQQRRG